MAGGGSPDGHPPLGPEFTPRPPSRLHAGAHGGGGRTRPLAEHDTRTVRIRRQWLTRQQLTPQGPARRPRTPDNLGRARRGEGRTRPPYRTPPPPRPLARHRARVSSGPRAVAPDVSQRATAARPGRRRAAPGHVGEPNLWGGQGLGLQASPPWPPGDRTGGPKGDRGTALPRPARPPLPPSQPAECRRPARGRQPCTPAPGQPPPPPILPPGRTAAPGAERHRAHACARPRTVTCPLCSHSDLGGLWRWPAHRPACQPPASAQGRPTAPPSDQARTGAHGHEPEQYGDHTLNGQSDTNVARISAHTREAEGQTEAERPPAPPPPRPPDRPRPSRAPRGGGNRTPPHTHTHTPHARPPQTHRPTHEAATQSLARGLGTRPPPPTKLRGARHKGRKH